MPTAKKRINVTIDDETYKALASKIDLQCESQFD
jgi:hypothetical protein